VQPTKDPLKPASYFMKLLIATNNSGKLEDYKLFCAGTNIEPVSLSDIGITQEFDEVHDTFEENAKAKAEFYFGLAGGIPALADDSGIEVPYWNMEPGVKTKRWGNNNDINFIVDKIKEIPASKRQARMRAVLGLVTADGVSFAEGIIKGKLTDKPFLHSTTAGYPWDKVFVLDENGKYYEELTQEENLKYNHRKIAFEKLRPFLL
jgi:XTP/dITP diphosphohydrolase